MRIGDVKRLTGVDTATIRYWEERGCITATRTDNKYRSYTQDDVNHILKIKQFREIGIPIADIKLWVDNLITTKELLTEYLKVLDSHSSANTRNRELVNAMLSGSLVETTDSFFEEDTPLYEGDLVLGVDIGTTTISAQLLSLADHTCVHAYCIEHDATIKETDNPNAFAVDANKLCDIAIGLVKAATKVYSNITAVGVTGQMHGIVCLDEKGRILSPLYTWQNQFGNDIIGNKTVCESIREITGKSYPTGYGLVTYYALKEKQLLPEGTAKIACIADVAVMKLCGDTSPLCHATHAASLGFFDIQSNRFDYESLQKLGIDKAILPDVVGDYTICGSVENAEVAVSIGDNQAGVLASITDNQILLNIGTSGQICLIDAYPNFDAFRNTSVIEVRPFFDDKYICIGASLCGGKALATLADLLFEIHTKLGGKASKPDVYNLINASAEQGNGSLKVSTAFLGTRDNPKATGKIDHITLSNFNLAELSYSFAEGIIDELYSLYAQFKKTNPEKLVIAGNAIRKNPVLRQAATQAFGCEVEEPRYTEEAAVGAALFAAKGLYEHSREKGV